MVVCVRQMTSYRLHLERYDTSEEDVGRVIREDLWVVSRLRSAFVVGRRPTQDRWV